MCKEEVMKLQIDFMMKVQKALYELCSKRQNWRQNWALNYWEVKK